MSDHPSSLLILVSLVLLIFFGCAAGDPAGEPSTSRHESLSVASLAGTWAGSASSTYYCESSPASLEIVINGSDLTVTGGTALALGTVGIVTQQGGQAFLITFGGRSPFDAQFFVDSSAAYGVWIRPNGIGAGSGQVALLQKSGLSDVLYSENDVLGSWGGMGVRTRQDFQVDSTFAGSMTIALGTGLMLSGSDGEGTFAGGDPSLQLEGAGGVWESGFRGATTIDWVGGATREALYFLSYDKSVLAGAFLTSICDLNVFGDMTQHTFALWSRQ